jgi:hypothetical protein
MTPLLQAAFEKIASLPDREQGAIVARLLEELRAAAEEHLPPGVWLGGSKPTQEATERAVEKILELRDGTSLGPGLMIRDLIEEGR